METKQHKKQAFYVMVRNNKGRSMASVTTRTLSPDQVIEAVVRAENKNLYDELLKVREAEVLEAREALQS